MFTDIFAKVCYLNGNKYKLYLSVFPFVLTEEVCLGEELSMPALKKCTFS